ncbi:dienelactone hydrolase family protein [Actinocrispum wychmicini]|uniref:Carboxymethylenebutenolidase n=1 Tax=Actinocrispum wychmicini TaxID=1213861 RepID=A0A4R2K8C3_9PSEU|nr:dienelactone hydrolase family protein [Actinocrispum wychmicini]TCO62635.1 carboxymethylenebutenolidase [Actinocrispum wychmicini]
MSAQRTESVSAPDGKFDLRVWPPESGRGPGVLILQEIFGVGEYIEAVAADLTALGYVVAAPDLYWRISPGWNADHTEQGLHDSVAVRGRFDVEGGVTDSVTALRHFEGLPEIDGGVAVLGFCLGGSLAFKLAAQVRPTAVVSFYGSEVPNSLSLLEQIKSPLQLHFGGQDPYIPADSVSKVADAVEGHDNIELHIQADAGHAFHNRVAPMFYQPEPAARAWQLTEEFLATHL